MFFLYKIHCRTENYVYIGLTQDPNRRYAEHCSGHGAVFTKKHGCLRFEIIGKFSDLEGAKLGERYAVMSLTALYPHYTIRGAGWSGEKNVPKKRGF